MTGIILSGGKGTRLGELTRVINKSTLPLGDSPLIYHSINKLSKNGINEIYIVTGVEHLGGFVELLGSGSRFGASFTYKVQDEALGIAHALGLWDKICKEKCIVILGDNVFQDDLSEFIKLSKANENRALVGITKVPNPTEFGNIEFNIDGSIKQIVEKPKKALSDYIVTGIYSYPLDVFDVIKTLTPSARGEYEITSVNNHYLNQGRLDTYKLNGWWVDSGTVENYHKANRLIYKYKD